MQLYIIASQVSKEVSEEDREIEGVYAIVINEDIKLPEAVSAALDIFHAHITVGTIDDFEFFVTDGKTILEESDDSESGLFPDDGYVNSAITEVPDLHPNMDTLSEWVGLHYKTIYETVSQEKKDDWLQQWREFEIAKFLEEANS
jgi:hypothetical protein